MKLPILSNFIILTILITLSSISIAQPPNINPPGFTPKNTDEQISYYEQYATGVRLALPELIEIPKSAVNIANINQSLNNIDKITTTYRHIKDASNAGQPVIWDLPTSMNLLTKEVQNIINYVKAIHYFGYQL